MQSAMRARLPRVAVLVAGLLMAGPVIAAGAGPTAASTAAGAAHGSGVAAPGITGACWATAGWHVVRSGMAVTSSPVPGSPVSAAPGVPDGCGPGTAAAWAITREGGSSPAAPPAHAATASPDAVPGYTLTITGTTLSGKPDTGDSVFVGNVDDSNLTDLRTATQLFRDGTAQVSVPAGHYWAIAVFGRGSQQQGVAPAARVVVLPEFTVDKDTTVHVAERAASSKVKMSTPRPARAQSTNFYVVRAASTGPEWDFQISNGGRHGNPGGPLWVSPVTARPATGRLVSYTSQELTAPPGAGIPYVYALSYAGPAGVIPPQRYRVRQAGLATLDELIYQETGSGGEWDVYGGFGPAVTGWVEPYPILSNLPGRLIQYIGGNAAPAMHWAAYYQGHGRGAGYSILGAFRAVRPGDHRTESWNQYPLHPEPVIDPDQTTPLNSFVVPASRSGDTLTLDITPFMDNQPGHYGGYGFGQTPGAKVTGYYRIDQDGTKVASGNPVTAPRPVRGGLFYTQVRLGPRPSTVRFVLDAARTGPAFRLSSRSKTVWTWRSAHEAGDRLPGYFACSYPAGPSSPPPRACVVEPMMTLLYHVHGMALNGITRPGRQVMDITAGHLQLARASRITGVTVQVSADDGATWRPASVTRRSADTFRVVFPAARGAYMTLRVHATDATGGSITETITRGYQIAA
jgi:hypothetical protein